MHRKTILLIFMAVMLCTGAFALSHSFEAYAGATTYEVCSCSQIKYTFDVLNTGDFPAGFGVEGTGALFEFTTYSPFGFVLEPGQQQTVNVFVNVPCNIKGTKSLNTRIYSDLNGEKFFYQKLRVNECSNVEATLLYSPPEGCRCGDFNYGLLVKNTGFYEDTFTVEALNFTKELTLKPNETSSTEVLISPPCEWDTRVVPLTVVSKNTGYTEDLKLPLNVNTNCADKEFEEKGLDIWGIVLGALVGIIIIVLLLIIFLIVGKNKGKPTRKRPDLYHLDFETPQKSNLWIKIVAVIVVLAVLSLVAWASITYLPKLFTQQPPETTGEGGMFDITVQEPVDEDIFSNYSYEEAEPGKPLGFWGWTTIGMSILFIAVIVLFLIEKGTECKPCKVIRIILEVLFILGILGIAGYFVYKILLIYGAVLISLIWTFFLLYWTYIVAGLVILFILILIVVFNNKKKAFPHEHDLKNGENVCEFCGRSFKTVAGLARHKQAKHK